jgi:glycosyltransferase involved in cell wall biosynthesis
MELFFSIVVPAHNEALYIRETLQRLAALEYPKDRYESIIIENGSTDETFALAQKFVNERTRVIQSAKGVSRARNTGIDVVSKESDWIIFLDADTLLDTTFLRELNNKLQKTGNRYTIGTVSLQPAPLTRQSRLWFLFYDLGHWLTKTSYSIVIAKHSCFPPARFREELVIGEDLELITQLRRFGKFFFLRTKSVHTSTRRFEKLGWWYVFFHWTFVAMLPAKQRRKFSYRVVR